MRVMNFGREAFDFIDDLNSLPNIDAVMSATRRALARYGFEHFSFSGIPRSSECLPGAVLAYRVPAELFGLYMQRRYADVDPAMRRLRQTVEPFRWGDVPYDPEREPRAVELMALVADFGLSQGFFVPIPSAAGTYAKVWMAGPQPELTAQTKPALHLMALYAFDRVQRLVGAPPSSLPQLSPREREVLSWVAAGKSTWQISEVLGISERTVNEHVVHACRKLGSANRTHAVAIALRERIIEI
jgi:LuxR family quorum sensing-dependent transcriptional regulator